MEAIGLAFPRSDERTGNTKYVRIENDVYLVDLEKGMTVDDWGNAIRAIVAAERLIHSVCRFFLVWTCVVYDSISLGNFKTVRVSSRLSDGHIFVHVVESVVCPQEVREAFKEEIGVAA